MIFFLIHHLRGDETLNNRWRKHLERYLQSIKRDLISHPEPPRRKKVEVERSESDGEGNAASVIRPSLL